LSEEELRRRNQLDEQMRKRILAKARKYVNNAFLINFQNRNKAWLMINSYP